jgi:P27 family predicted phage terminase small subunit
MGKSGTAPRPRLTVLREGNPGHRTKRQLERGVKLPPGAPAEPDWGERFGPVPGDRRLSAEAARARARASREWQTVVPVLDAMGLLAQIDATVLEDWCTLVARLDQCERDITRRGLIMADGRRNSSTMAAQGIRQRMGRIEGQLGLTPVARDQMRGNPREAGNGEGSPFDV